MERINHTKKSVMGRVSLAVGALSLACLLQGCSRLMGNSQDTQALTDETTHPAVTSSAVTTPQEAQTAADTSSDPTTAMRSYYEKLISSLRQELLDEREDRYISDVEYKLRVEELEATVAALEEALNREDDLPTGGEPADTLPPEAVTQPPEAESEGGEINQAPIEFTYRVVEGKAHITGYTGSNTTVHIPSELEGYTVVALDDSAFQNSEVKAVVLPATVTTVGWFAFSGCFELELVTLPASVSKINYGAFDNCPNLTLLCPADSYAEAYAMSFGLPYRYV